MKKVFIFAAALFLAFGSYSCAESDDIDDVIEDVVEDEDSKDDESTDDESKDEEEDNTDTPSTGTDYTEALASLEGFDYFVIALDDTSYATISDQVVADMRFNGANSQLYVWGGLDEVETSGTNSFGVDASWGAYSVTAPDGWSGFGYCYGVEGDLEYLDMLSATTHSPEEYYLHVALMSTTAVNFEIKLENSGTSATCIVGNNGGDINYDFVSDGTWQYFDIPMTVFTAQGLSYSAANTVNANTFCMLCGSTAGTDINYDAVFFYKKVDSEMSYPEVGGSDDDGSDDDTAQYTDTTWDGTVATAFDSGDGSAASPYVIDSAAELAYLSSWANGATLENVYFSLEADLNLNNLAWDAIGNNTFFFWGQFAGNGHTISGISITGSESYQGLFAAVGNNGRVSDLSVSGSIEAFENVGGVVGFNFGVIENCSSSVAISANLFGGGIAGYNQGTGVIVNCSNSGSVTAGNHNGGVAGYAWGVIANCYNEGAVGNIESTYYSGGIVGYCNSATITNCYNVGTVKGVATQGGVVGYNENGSIVNCTSLSGCAESAQSVYGEAGVELTADQMTAAAFVSTLNNNAATYNATSPSVAACAWAAGSTYPVLDAEGTPSANSDGYDGYGDGSTGAGGDDSDDSDDSSSLIQGYADDGTISLAGSDYFVISMDATSLAKIDGKITADFTSSTWAGTWAGYSAASCVGNNSYGVDASWNAYTVYSSDGWSGLGHIGGADETELAKLDAMAAITASPNDYYLHIAFKSEVAATHMVKFESGGTQAIYAIGNNGAQVDGLEPAAALVSDGTWYHYDIPVTALTSQGLAFSSANTAATNVFMIFSGAVDTTLDYDAVFFYKK